MKIGDVDTKLETTDGYLDTVMLNDKQLDRFLNKLSFHNLEELETILYFNGFAGDRGELVEILNKKTYEYLAKKETYEELIKRRTDIIDNLKQFNIKELYFLHNLFTEAELSSSVDMEGINYYDLNEYYNDALGEVYKELKKRQH